MQVARLVVGAERAHRADERAREVKLPDVCAEFSVTYTDSISLDEGMNTVIIRLSNISSGANIEQVYQVETNLIHRLQT